MKKNYVKVAISEKAQRNLNNILYEFRSNEEEAINRLLEEFTSEVIIFIKYLSEKENETVYKAISNLLFDNNLPKEPFRKDLTLSCLKTESFYRILNVLFKQMELALRMNQRIDYEVIKKIVFLFEINSSNNALENHSEYQNLEPHIKENIVAINNYLLPFVSIAFKNNAFGSVDYKIEEIFPEGELRNQMRITGKCSMNEITMNIYHSWGVLTKNKEILKCVFKLLEDFTYLIFVESEETMMYYNNPRLCFELLDIILNNELILS